MASRTIPRSLLSTILRAGAGTSTSTGPAPLLRPYPHLPRTLQPVTTRRSLHKIPRPTRRPTEQQNAATKEAQGGGEGGISEVKKRKLLEPHYILKFTCIPCGTGSSHIVSKQGYHNGSVLIACPECRNRHIISDNLRIFGDTSLTIEDIMREKGQLVKRGTLGEDGDVEFYPDGPWEEVPGTGAEYPVIPEETSFRKTVERPPLEPNLTKPTMKPTRPRAPDDANTAGQLYGNELLAFQKTGLPRPLDPNKATYQARGPKFFDRNKDGDDISVEAEGEVSKERGDVKRIDRSFEEQFKKRHVGSSRIGSPAPAFFDQNTAKSGKDRAQEKAGNVDDMFEEQFKKRR
ncbi:DNL zinc finger-domain-containing protein [Poronia punctata]|nr:DNL zinc finger-domain-containing protein [Poronia punctata]